MAMTKKSVLSKMPICHTAAKKNGLLRNAQTRKDLSVVQQYVQVKHKVIDLIVQSLCWSQLQMMFLLFKMSLSAAHTTAHQTAILGGRCSMESATSGAAAELKCRSMDSHLATVTSQKIHDFLKQDVSENYVFMKSLNIAGEDPKWYLGRRTHQSRSNSLLAWTLEHGLVNPPAQATPPSPFRGLSQPPSLSHLPVNVFPSSSPNCEKTH